MAKDNYSYERYKRELAKKKKREAKMQLKLDRKNNKLKESLGQASGNVIILNPEQPVVAVSDTEKEIQ